MKYRPSTLARLLCFSLVCALIAPPSPAAAGQPTAPRRIAPAMRVMRQSAAPASDLPDLNAIRQFQPAAPAAAPVIPSTACSPLNPGCQSGNGVLRSPFLDPRHLSSDSYQLASNLGTPSFGSLRSIMELAVMDTPSGLLATKITAKRATSATPAVTGITSALWQTSRPETPGFYRGDTYYLRHSSTTGPAQVTTAYGRAGWVPVVGDWDGNGTTTLGIYVPEASEFGAPNQSFFFLSNSVTSSYGDLGFAYGLPGDKPLAGDWDGNGTVTVGVYRPSNSTFYLRNSNSAGPADLVIQYGQAGDVPVVGDWNGDGVDTIGVYRDYTFLLRNSNSAGAPDVSTAYGNTGWLPVVGDWDGNGTTTLGVVVPDAAQFGAPGQSLWFLSNSVTSSYADKWFVYGLPGDKPVAGDWDGLPPPARDAVFVSQSVPSSMSAGQSYNVSVRMRNTGTETWTAASNYNLGSQNPQDNIIWGVGRVALPSSVATNAEVTFTFPVTAPSAPGSYNFRWQMVEDFVAWFGDYTTNVAVAVNPNNQPPTVGVTSPTAGASFANDSTVNITADASDSDGTVSKVEFYQNGIKLGEDTTAPYALAWDHAAAGSYSITTRATDNAGATTTSSPVNITVTPPSVSIVATDANASEQGPDAGVFTVTRTGGTSQPLAVSYAVSGTAANGGDYATLPGAVTIPAGASSQTITVNPIDDATVEGNETVTLTLSANSSYSVGSPANATVTIADNDTYPPSVSVTSPVSGSVVTAPATITITANASDSDGTVAKVEFYQGATKLGEDTSAPYSFTWSNVAAGSYSLTAVATDNVGATGSSAAVGVVVNSAPTVSVTGPAGGTLFTAPAAINISASAADGDGTVAKVEFFRDGVKIGEDASAPYSFAWNSVSAGSYSLTAVATDDHGAATTSAPINITVNSAPSVSLSAPSAGTVFNAPALISLAANASDADGTISKVEFYQGQTKLSEDASAPYTFDWTNVPSGSYTLTAVGTDDRGATTTSASVNVTVNGPPTVSLTSPANNAGVTRGSDITITAAASDGDGTVAKVEFFQGSTKLGERAAAPYTLNWSSPPTGAYSLTAVATDNTGATATSQPVSINVVDFTSALLDAGNRTGSDDLFSRNFNWGTGLVHLPGRAGLDLDVSLSYSSLVWLRSGAAMLYDPDRGFPTPGFRLGFPVVHGPYQNASADNAISYVLVTPSGGREELRRKAGTTNTYESIDSSYVRLVEGGGALVLYPGDGSAVTFQNLGGEYQCTGVKDRNGNYLTVAYTAFNRVDKITDTLGREVKFNYDAYQNPTSITQVRTVGGQAQTHVWATFGYESKSVNSAFSGVSGLSVFGTVNRPVPVLTQVGLDDGTLYKFAYNTRGQVERVTRSAENASGQWVDLSYVAYQMNDDGTDCPRYTESSVWAKEWNNEEAATTTYGVEGDWQTATMPDGTVEKVQYGTTGRLRGLALATETWGTVNGSFDKRRWTTTTWTQDNTTLDYPLNPRVTASAVSDSGNSRRTVVEYLTAQESAFRLPKKVSEYNGAEATPLRSTETDYELTYDYTETGHIVGLVKERRLKDGAGALQSRVAYDYDTAGCVVNQAGAVRHDDNYDSTVKRGALCSVTRYKTDATDTVSPDSIVAARMTYNSLGLLLSTADALDHKTTTAYQDGFADGVGRNTYAYPTSATDADQNARPANETRLSATVTYDFDTGRAVRARDLKGAEAVTEYDAAGRTTKVTRHDGVNNVDAGYTRVVYSPGQDFVASFAQVDSNVESFSVQVLDGAGRVRATAAIHPNSEGGYRGQIVSYDKLGQAVKQYQPVEINSSWAVTGDDSGTGWTYSSQTYDWKGRPLVATNIDGTQQSATYDGCGCAGGDVVTLTDEVGKRQKVYHDVLGHVVKSEVLNADMTVYSTATTLFNALDEATRTRAYQGAAPNPEPSADYTGQPGAGAYQTGRMAYDGYGRLHSAQSPMQTAATLYTYNNDDTPQQVTDGRGATTNLTYNARGLTRTVTFGVPAGVEPTAAVEYQYDAAGNRVWMTDGLGRVDYGYDALSRMTSETRTFSDAENAAVSGVARTVSYDYTVGGGLKSVTDPFGARVDYVYDAAGQLTGVNGSPYSVGGTGGVPAGQVTEYAHGLKYRAWGAMKEVTYGNNLRTTLGYTGRGQMAEFKVDGQAAQFGASVVMDTQQQYYEDGALKSAGNQINHRFDRAYTYDQVGRLKEAFSGAQALSFTQPAPSNSVPYWQKYEYDALGQMTKRDNQYWTRPDTFTATYDAHGRRADMDYDVDGRTTQDNNGVQYYYDAAGRNRTMTDNSTIYVSQWHDGDSQVEKHMEVRLDENGQVSSTERTYYVRSSVLGGSVISELDGQGGKVKSKVYLGSAVLAELTSNNVTWRHDNPVTGNRGYSGVNGGYAEEEMELDPEGVNVGKNAPVNLVTPSEVEGVPGLMTDAGVPYGKCQVDGMGVDCAWAMEMKESGSAVECPNNDCGPRTIFNPNTGRSELSLLNWNPKTGKLGYWDWRLQTTRVDVGVHRGDEHPQWDQVFISADTSLLSLSNFGGVHGSIGEVASLGPIPNPQSPTPKPTPQPCDPGFFDATDDTLNTDGSLKYIGFSGNDLNTVARVVYAEAAGTAQGGTDEEMDAILSVIYNRLQRPGYFNRPPNETLSDVVYGARRNRRGEIVGSIQFQSVTGFGGGGSDKWKNTAGDDYRKLNEAECNDLRRGIGAVNRFLERGGASHAFTEFVRARGRTPTGWTVIGGTRFR